MPPRKNKEEIVEGGVAVFQFEDGSVYNGCFTTVADDNVSTSKQHTLVTTSTNVNNSNNNKRLSNVPAPISAKDINSNERESNESNISALAEGKGVYRDCTGATYNGEWHDGKFAGDGVCEHVSESRYSGTFDNNLYHQYGSYTWSDKSFLYGKWEHGQIEGCSVFVDADGKHWIGEFAHGSCTALN